MKYLIIPMTFLLGTNWAFAQQNVTLSGYIRDGANGEELIGATLFVKERGAGVGANVYGFYSISLPAGDYTLEFSYLGYESLTRSIELRANATLNVELRAEGLRIEEIVVVAQEPSRNVTGVEMSVEKLSAATVKLMPAVLGEADLLRSLLMLPGVSTVGEGANGFNVRGGAADQNLILLDEAVVYNASHLFGLFSVFNPDAIKDVQLFKGGIPAQYGGRLSSVLDVRQREGNKKRLGLSGGLGIVSSRLTAEGPIQKDRSSFLASGRSSYGHLFLKFDPDLADNTVYFYDFNAKANFILNERNRIFVSGYFGKDVFNFSDQFTSNWGNATATIRWNHLFNEKLFSNFTAIFSDYGYSLGIPQGAQAFRWDAKIINYALKGDFSYYFTPNNKLDFGLQTTYYRFHPGMARGVGDESFFNRIALEHNYALEPAVYASYEKRFSPKLTLQIGLRYGAYYRLGEGSEFVYEGGTPSREAAIIDTLRYGPWDVISRYGGLEPRFSANYSLGREQAVKVSYNRMRQFIHLVSNTTSPTPVDVWTSSGPHIRPAVVDQVAGGYFRNFNDNRYEASIEVFYKRFGDLLDYIDGAELLLNETLERELLHGEGRAYGAEFIVRKVKGRLTGWAAYTLSRSERRVDGINQGEYYPANFDRLHDLSLAATWSLSPKWSISGNFAFQSGRPITYPDARFEYEGISIPVYSNRNGARTPAYHRFDLSANFIPGKRPDHRWKGEWNFGVYNLYGRRNPYSIFFRPNEDNPLETEAVRLSIFGAPLPYITYNFNF
jgi:hypothetical protein